MNDAAKKDQVRRAIKALEASKDRFPCPHWFTTHAGLFLWLKEDHYKERALSTLYEGYSRFPESIKTTSPLGEYIGELNHDFVSALKFDCKAMEIASKEEKKVSQYYETIRSHLAKAPSNPYTAWLRNEVERHEFKDKWRTTLSTWFGDNKVRMMNCSACDIAYGEIVTYEQRAREYAANVYAANTKEPAYIDTLGWVKFTFADSPMGGKEKDIKEAIALFLNAMAIAREREDEVALQEAGTHYRRALDGLRSR